MHPNQKLIMDWIEAKKQLDHWKKVEDSYRTMVMEVFYNYDEDILKEGSDSKKLPNGTKLTATYTINRKLSNKNGETRDLLDNLVACYGDSIEDCIKWEPKLAIGKFKKLPENIQKQFDKVLTEKPGKPQLKLVVEDE